MLCERGFISDAHLCKSAPTTDNQCHDDEEKMQNPAHPPILPRESRGPDSAFIQPVRSCRMYPGCCTRRHNGCYAQTLALLERQTCAPSHAIAQDAGGA